MLFLVLDGFKRPIKASPQIPSQQILYYKHSWLRWLVATVSDGLLRYFVAMVTRNEVSSVKGKAIEPRGNHRKKTIKLVNRGLVIKR